MLFAKDESSNPSCLRGCLAGGLALGLVPLNSALADVTGVFQGGGTEGITIEYRDDDHVRMRSPDGGYVVVTGGEAYMVSRERGDWVVYALEDFRALFQSMGMAIPDGVDMPPVTGTTEASAYQLRDTGRTETIAGIRGQVHEVVTSDGWNEETTGEVVLTDNRDAVDVYRGMLRVTGIMGEMAGQRGLDRFMAGMYGIEDRAILRADDSWRLESIERNAIPSNAFTLPAEPTEIEGMSALFGSGNDGEGGDAGEAGAAIGGWLGGLAQDVGGAADDEARSTTENIENEARDDVTDDVRDRVRRGIRGVFGR